MVLLSHMKSKLQTFRMKDYFKYKGRWPTNTGELFQLINCPFRVLQRYRRYRCTAFLAVYMLLMICCFFWLYLESTSYDIVLHEYGERKTSIPLRDFCSNDQTSKSTPTYFKINEDNFALAAYKDDRAWNSTVIRIFGLSRRKLSGYCLVQNTDTGYAEVSPMLVDYLSTEDHAKEFRTISITCRLGIPLAENPCYVRLSEKPDLRSQYVKLPLHSMYKVDPQYSFTVCLPVLAGPIQQSTLVEFIEFHQILGIDQFYIYQYAGDSHTNETNMNIAAVIDHYKNNNKVTIATWKLPVPVTSVSQYGSALAKQHCLYQNMWTSQFLFFPTLYQYLIPQDSTNWFNLLRHLTKPPGTKFCFQTFHFPHVVGELLLTMASMKRASESNKQLLCLIPPNYVDLADYHTQEMGADYSHIHVDINKGFVHDYLHRDKLPNTTLLVEDLSATKFKYELQIAFKRTMNFLFDAQMERYFNSK